MFDPKVLASHLAKNKPLDEYGDADLETILKDFGSTASVEVDAQDCDDMPTEREDAPLVDADACRRDWPAFRRLMSKGLAAKDFDDM
eukprot:gene16111-biopygen13563